MADQATVLETDAGVVEMTGAVALGDALDRALASDDKVVLIGEDIADPSGGIFKVTKGLSTKYGTDRVRSTPIAESGILGSAVGLALSGYRPIAEIMFMDFLLVGIDQLVNHAAKLRYMSGGRSPVPMVVRTTIGTSRFGAQHSQSLEAWLMHTPGLKVVMPSTPADYKGLLTSAIEDDDPVVFIEHLNLYFGNKQPVPEGDYRVPLGQARVVREGRDATVITWGPAVGTAVQAAESLMGRGIDVEVIDMRSLVPLDMETVLESVGETRRAVVLHEATRFCGAGAEIASQLHEQLFGDLLAPVHRVGAQYSPTAFSPALNGLPTSEDVVQAVIDMTGA